MNRALFKSDKSDWETPDYLFKYFNTIYDFTVDVCANQFNKKVDFHFDAYLNAFNQDWLPHRCWMNPPYGREIVHWMRHAHNIGRAGGLVVCLVPARTDTLWWHDHARHGTVYFLKGRVKFVGAENGAPFPSAVVIFNSTKWPTTHYLSLNFLKGIKYH